MPAKAVFFLAAVLCTPLLARAWAPPVTAEDSPRARYLVLCLDGVSYSLVEEMHRAGELPNFQPPSQLIVAFPSLTDTALAEILRPAGAPPSAGYEDYYFDREENHTRGGFFHRFRRAHYIEGTFRERFDYHPHPVVMTLEYGLPVFGSWLAAHITLGRIVGEFESSEEKFFLAYLDATDSLAHLSGKRFHHGLLRRLDRHLARLRRESDAPLEVIVFSDHGNSPARYDRVDLAEALEARGFRLTKRLETPRDVVFPRYGLVGSAVFYTRPEARAAVAEAVRSVTGVDLVAYQEEGAIVILHSTGIARLRRHGRDYCYEPASADPLDLQPVLARLEQAGRLRPGGCAADSVWWDATANHTYPDPLRRLWQAFGPTVANPASVIISLEEGYVAGNWVLDLLAALQTTHGSLHRAQSTGFVMSTARAFPPILRAVDLWARLPRQRTPPRLAGLVP